MFEPFTTTSKGLFSMPSKPIAYSGIGLSIDPLNEFVFPILRAEHSTFSYNKDKDNLSSVYGDALTLVSGY